MATFITFDTYIDYCSSNKFMYLSDIKETLKKLKLDKTGKKPVLLKRLDDFYKGLRFYYCNIDKIILIQNKVRDFLKWKKYKYLGDGFMDKSLCINDEDFLTFETKYEISDTYFFSYTDLNSKIFFFDIRSFKKLVEAGQNNPYTTQIIPNSAIDCMKKRITELKKNGLYDDIPEPIMTDEQKFNDKVLSIFQKIDMLDIAAGGTDPNWFHHLSFEQLKNYYKILEDIWYYRAELTDYKRNLIVPHKKMYITPPTLISKFVFSDSKKKTLQLIILSEMESLIHSAADDEHQKMGAYYILIALTEISMECAQALPWLVQ
jgi:hypothetical protein